MRIIRIAFTDGYAEAMSNLIDNRLSENEMDLYAQAVLNRVFGGEEDDNQRDYN